MDKCRQNIVVLEPSKIIYEGIYASISKSEYNYSFYHVDSLIELETILIKKDITIVLINPSLIQNKIKEFIKIQKQYSKIRWIGIIYSLFDNSTTKLFDNLFMLTDDVTRIAKIITKACSKISTLDKNDEQLSEREIIVLKHLAKGLSNKIIADKLNLSVHTINTHRKNIMDKTGIRSLAGLTIYAVSIGIISLD
ncbi:MAG: response regulator transcription factor [Bacteroidales bacterium]|nr:response regulator transcription factor [Bacteroidales bacterium]